MLADLAFATCVYIAMAMTEPLADTYFSRALRGNPPARLAWAEFGAPLLRAAAVVVFVLLAYPGLFGVRSAPGIGTLLGSEEARISTMLGTLFFVGFIASIMPGPNRNLHLVLPIQGCIATAFVFFSFCTYLGVTTATLWPGIDVALTMLVLSYCGHRAGRILGIRSGDLVNRRFDVEDGHVVVQHMADSLAQVPVVLLFGLGLGRQIAI